MASILGTGGGARGRDMYETYRDLELEAGRVPLPPEGWVDLEQNPQLKAMRADIVAERLAAEAAKGGAETAQGAAETAVAAANAARDQAELYSLNTLEVSRLAPTWANLLTLTGAVDGEGAAVAPSDPGQHNDATATGYDGAMVPNSAEFRWHETWGRWRYHSAAKSDLFAKASEGRARVSSATVDLDGYATGAGYDLTVSKVPTGGQLLSVTFHAPSTVPAPVLRISDGTTSYLTTLIIPFGLQAGIRYEIDFGTGTSRVYEPGQGVKATVDGMQAAIDAEVATRVADVDAITKKLPVSYTSTVSGTGSAFTMTSNVLPQANTVVLFVPHVDSVTGSYPSLAVTVGGVTVQTLLGARDGTPPKQPFKAGGVYALRWGNSVSRVFNDTDPLTLDRLAALEEAAGGSAVLTTISPDDGRLAQVGLAVPGNQESDGPLSVSNGRPFQWQPWFKGAMLHMAGSPGVVDLTHLVVGSSATILARSGDKILAGAGRNFLGRSEASGSQSGSVTAAAGANSVFDVRRFNGSLCLVQLSGAAPTYGAEDIAYDHMIVGGGQSNVVRMWDEYGLGGFTMAMAKKIKTPQDLSFQLVNGATGGTAIDKRSVAAGSDAYWWDAETGQPGPALLTCLAAIADAKAVSGLDPVWTFWTQGESDAPAVGAGTITPAQMKASVLAVFGHIRSVHPGMQFIVNSIGAHDLDNADPGVTAARTVYHEVIAEQSYCYRGADLYDLPRRMQDIHYRAKAYAVLGVRLAKLWANYALGQSNDTAPRVTGATLEDAHTVRLAVSGGPLYSPLPVVYGPRPCGLYAMAGGAGPTAETIDLSSAYVDGASIVVTSENDLTGCQIGGPYGWARDTRGGLVFRNYKSDDYHDWPGDPLESFRVTAV